MFKIFKNIKLFRKISKGKPVDIPINIQNIIIKTNKIKIPGGFENNPPNPIKLDEKDNYYMKNGKFKENIVLNKYNFLADGYTTYLLAIKYGVKTIKVIKNMGY
jgi:hypothetical protein